MLVVARGSHAGTSAMRRGPFELSEPRLILSHGREDRSLQGADCPADRPMSLRRLQVLSKASAFWRESGVSGGKILLCDVLAKSAQRSVVDTAIRQHVAKRLPVCPADEVVCR